MKRARDVRDQLVNLLTRVEVDLVSNPLDTVNIRKVSFRFFFFFRSIWERKEITEYECFNLHRLLLPDTFTTSLSYQKAAVIRL